MSDDPGYDPQQTGPQQTGPQPGFGQQPDYRASGRTPAMSPQDERTWGALAHAAALLAMILSAGFLGFLGSLAVYVIHKDRGPFVRAHAANSLNVQITMFIWIVISIPLILLLGLGFLTLIAAPFVAGLLHVIGAMKAYQGEWWNPPLTPRLVK